MRAEIDFRQENTQADTTSKDQFRRRPPVTEQTLSEIYRRLIERSVLSDDARRLLNKAESLNKEANSLPKKSTRRRSKRAA